MILTGLLTVCFITAPAQSGSHKKNNREAAPKPATPIATPVPTPPDAGSKRNSRPSDQIVNTSAAGTATAVSGASYSYEFDRPGFVYGHVNIEHDDAGRGTISFVKQGYADAIKDPIALSAVTMDKLRKAFDALNFIDSAENYQHEKDFSHMGNVSISLRRDGRTRTAKYNWTDNKLAKELMDEYRWISNEYTWRFEMSLARENHPLDVPGLMETMDRYIARGEISDPQHIVPLLEQFSTDERLPLMARNRAAKLVKQLARQSK